MADVSVQVYHVAPTKAASQGEGNFLCYTADSPIPWDQKIFVANDDRGRTWFCHEWHKPLNDTELRRAAETIRASYNKCGRKDRLRIDIAATRVGDLSELSESLGKIDLKD